ncbi:hypothetical protein FB451DRAFT_1366076 [Mycena latifolia]|nr:hypothetical protein FB451DRAFT_1366076 [Mycena latifolia]
MSSTPGNDADAAADRSEYTKVLPDHHTFVKARFPAYWEFEKEVLEDKAKKRTERQYKEGSKRDWVKAQISDALITEFKLHETMLHHIERPRRHTIKKGAYHTGRRCFRAFEFVAGRPGSVARKLNVQEKGRDYRTREATVIAEGNDDVSRTLSPRRRANAQFIGRAWNTFDHRRSGEIIPFVTAGSPLSVVQMRSPKPFPLPGHFLNSDDEKNGSMEVETGGHSDHWSRSNQVHTKASRCRDLTQPRPFARKSHDMEPEHGQATLFFNAEMKTLAPVIHRKALRRWEENIVPIPLFSCISPFTIPRCIVVIPFLPRGLRNIPGFLAIIVTSS